MIIIQKIHQSDFSPVTLKLDLKQFQKRTQKPAWKYFSNIQIMCIFTQPLCKNVCYHSSHANIFSTLNQNIRRMILIKEVEKHIIHKIIYMQAYYMHIHTHIVWNCVLTLITCLSCNKLLHVYSYIHGENVFLQSSQEIFH